MPACPTTGPCSISGVNADLANVNLRVKTRAPFSSQVTFIRLIQLTARTEFLLSIVIADLLFVSAGLGRPQYNLVITRAKALSQPKSLSS